MRKGVVVKVLTFEEKCRLFHLGEAVRCHELFGVFPEASSFVFRTFAPSADSVFVVGSFNDWQETCQMDRITSEGIYEARIDVDKIKAGDSYKYKIYRGGEAVYVADPFARGVDQTPYLNSTVPDVSCSFWRDGGWMEQRAETAVSGFCSQPINVYEIDLASWKRSDNGGYYNYLEIAQELAPYVKQMGYTHVQLLPLTEGRYAPSSSFGDFRQLMSFVDILHRAGIGVIFAWKACLPEECLEYSEKEKVSFVASNAIYWIEDYHIDGLYVSADDDKFDAELLRKVCCAVRTQFTDVLIIADKVGELDADLAWDRAWMRETLDYAATDFKERSQAHEKLKSSIDRAFGGKYILPVPHGEVTDGKKSFLDKMPGDYWKKFAGARAFEALKMTTPGKKLSFMGAEIGQFSEWTRERGVEWFLLDFESHARHQLFVSELNNFYLAHPELWQGDKDTDSFRWIDADDRERNIISFKRVSAGGNELITVINFAPHTCADYFLPVSEDGIYEEVFNSDDLRYGGSGVTNKGIRFASMSNPCLPEGVPAEKISPRVIRLRLPPLGATILRLVKKRFEDIE
jgi:1,4-alpha-glucan branching enzyme